MLSAADINLHNGIYNDGRVGDVQRALNAKMGAGLTVDNDFGPRTEQAVRQFQAGMGLATTGVVDATTWNILITGAQSAMPDYQYQVADPNYSYETVMNPNQAPQGVQQYSEAIGPLPAGGGGGLSDMPWYVWAGLAVGAYYFLGSGKSKGRRRRR